MKTQNVTTALAFLVAAFMWGCQEQASSPVGLEGLGPQFGAKSCADNPKQGKCKGSSSKTVSLFVESGGTKGVLGAAMCDVGAAQAGQTVGHVTWQNIRRTDSHTHANVVLSGATSGIYDIYGNQDVLCDKGNIDFDLSGGHKRVVTVDANGDGDVRIGLIFGGDDLATQDPEGHAPGPHKLWLTFVPQGAGAILRSVAFEVVIKDHSGHGGG